MRRKITIYSTWLGLGPIETWTGEVALDNRHNMNEEVYLLFNRQTSDDVSRLDGIGYMLPSISIGDVIYYHPGVLRRGQTWVVDAEGFTRVC